MNEYSTKVFEVNDEFILIIEELNIIVKSKSLVEAYSILSAEKEEFLTKMKENELSVPKALKQEDSSNNKIGAIKEFTLKSLILTGLCLLLFFVSGFAGGIAFKKGVDTVSSKVMARSSGVTELSEEEKLELFRDKLKSFSPYILEIKKVLNE